MKDRIVTALIGLPAVLLILTVAPKLMTAVVLGAALAMAAYEMLFVTGMVRHSRMVLYSCIMSFAISIWSFYGASRGVGMLMLTLFWILLFTECMADHVKVGTEMAAMCMLGGAVAPYLLSAVIRLQALTVGRYLVIIPFLIAFVSDSAAYTIGVRFGRHRLAPVISPRKTWEGLGAGIAAGTLGMLIYAVILALVFRLNVNFLAAIVYGFVGSGVGVVGDLSLSSIKRQSGIKDFGHVLPGHGGIYDRLDSLLLIAPVIEGLFGLMPVVR